MKSAWKIFRFIVFTMAFILIAIPVSLYIILSTNWAQNDIRRVAGNELSALLGTDVTLGRVEIHPFNRLSIYDIKAQDDYGKTALSIDEISVAFELFYLLRTGKLVVDFALVDAPSLSLYKKTSTSSLNIAEILKGLKSDNKNKPQSHYDLMVNTVIIRDGEMKFDILDAPERDSIFDVKHIAVSDVFLNAYIPRISNDEYRVEIDRFSLKEQHGFELTNLKAAADITPHGSDLEYLTLRFPNSELSINPVSLDNNGFSGLEEIFNDGGINVGIRPGSIIYPPDFSAFAPQLVSFQDSIEIILDGNISADHALVNRMTIAQPDGKFVGVVSAKAENIKDGVNASFEVEEFRFSAQKSGLSDMLKLLPHRNPQAEKLISGMKSGDNLSINVKADGKINNSRVRARMALGDNAVLISANYSTPDTFKTVVMKTDARLTFNNLTALAGPSAPQTVTSSLRAEGVVSKYSHKLSAQIDSTHVYYRGHNYGPLSLMAHYDNGAFEASFLSKDRQLALELDCAVELDKPTSSVDAVIDIFNINPGALGLIKGYDDYELSASANANFEFSSIDDITGNLYISDIVFADNDPQTRDLRLNSISVEALPLEESPGLSLQSDAVSAFINGSYRFSTLISDITGMASTIFPAIGSDQDTEERETDFDNNFTYSLRIAECEDICKFFRLPVSVIYPVDVYGHISSDYRTASLSLTAPYLLQGDKIIENTMLTANIDADANLADARVSTKMPTKKGPMSVVADLKGHSNRLDNRIDWVIERKIPINGSFDFSTILARDISDNLVTSIIFNPGTITFGDDVWTVNPSTVDIESGRFVVERFGLTADGKSISIHGIVSDEEEDELNINLSNIALLDIFETLEIDKALIGGTASGDFVGRALLSPEPEIYCHNLHVDSISYNRCVLGDADIIAFWDNDKRSFNLDADVVGATGLHSRIYGDIIPVGEGIDITFDVNHVPVGFMKPFMEAFASDLSGYASGKARLFGTFKYIDMEGDVFADDLKIKIDFTNTWYSVSDSIHLTPGRIDINKVTIFDTNNHTALLSGIVRHKFFKEPSFNFTVSDAKNFLSYNVDSRQSPDWYGSIYGNGGATISGEPGVVNIGVNMATAPKSTFTFVLSDRLDADEYSFITFKDSRAEARRDSLLLSDKVPSIVRLLRERLGANDGDSPSAYNMDLQIDITPDAKMALVMDPVGGDEIKATGSGNLRLTYESLNNDLKMYGTYSLNRGSYNFTLQDIIIKDFTIKEGSTIAFHGDPYSAQLDIEAIYAVNANLSDLDESFLLDKDLNRTNVPVHALLKVTGDMRQPDIDFDLEFPTLTQDTYRKVKSIVSTKEMMNRQIIYLLALNRFYTPDYMASTTKGNELFSVASSTISSQLSSMLGKLSEDWSIAPNLRSDRGDFSDVEVDVALSSRLLNNRLLFNGNFGYRDKTLNTNQFIGDFDIEYLLNPKGSWRLKAYNRYNDQNYYVRTAQTTQGVGLVFKKDFDNFFNFLRREKRTIDFNTPADSINSQPIVIPDSIAHPSNPLSRQ